MAARMMAWLKGIDSVGAMGNLDAARAAYAAAWLRMIQDRPEEQRQPSGLAAWVLAELRLLLSELEQGLAMDPNDREEMRMIRLWLTGNTDVMNFEEHRDQQLEFDRLDAMTAEERREHERQVIVAFNETMTRLGLHDAVKPDPDDETDTLSDSD